MRKKIIILGAVVFGILGVQTLVPLGNVFADSYTDKVCKDDPENLICKNDCTNDNSKLCESDVICELDPDNPACNDSGNLFERVKNIMNVVLSAIGVVAVVVIIISGLTMTLSNGDAGKVKKAKSAIVYALVGLIISLLALTIVNFVLDSLG